MKKYFIHEVEDFFGFESARDISKSDILSAFDGWCVKLRGAREKKYIGQAKHIETLENLYHMATYLKHVVNAGIYDSELEKSLTIKLNREMEKIKREKRKSELITAYESAKKAAAQASFKDDDTFSKWMDRISKLEELIKKYEK